MNRFKAAFVAAAVALGGLGIVAAASAPGESTCNLMGLTYDCSYGVTTQPLPHGTHQVFVVGTDHTVWTNYNRSDGSWYGWQYLGGVVDGGIKVSGVTDGGWVFSVVAGTDGYPWSRTRSADGSNWTGWALPACPDPDDDAGCS